VAIQRSKVKEGTLHLGGATPIDLSCAPTNIRMTPSSDVGDEVETLCGDVLPGEIKTTWVLQGSSIQDFNDPAGFLAFAFDYDGENVPFTWTPNLDGPTFDGTVRVAAMEIGGDVNGQLTSDFSWPMGGKPTRTEG
jgi:hypothetical protein